MLSSVEICMMAHFHSFATIMFKKKNKKKKKKKKKKKNKKRNNFLKMYCENTCNVSSHFSHYKPMETLKLP